MDEHKNLQISQFEVGTDANGRNYIHYNGRTSKSLNGGLKQRKISSQNIRHYTTPGCDSDRDLHRIYSTYFEMVGKSGCFYKQPLDGLRFSTQPIGINSLSKLIKTMCDEAGIIGHFTNHSGKRTCVMSLFQAGIEEKNICKRSGHRSLAVRDYEVPLIAQEQKV
jgi:integrase